MLILWTNLLNLDVFLLRLLNVDLANPNMDGFWLAVTHLDRQLWFKFIVLPVLLGWLFYIYRWALLRMLFVLILTVGATDLLCYRVIKALVDRPRPFQNAAISSWVRKVDDAHGSSFPSNHAANCFAGAMILAWYFRRRAYYFYAIAALVAVSRVILGVHYPSDVVAGAMLGLGVGFLFRITVILHFKGLWFNDRAGPSDDADGWRGRIA